MGNKNSGRWPRNHNGIAIKPYKYREGKVTLKIRDRSGVWQHCGIFGSMDEAIDAADYHKMRLCDGKV